MGIDCQGLFGTRGAPSPSEMMPGRLKETTMDPMKRTMLRVELLTDEKATSAKVVEQLMSNKPEERFRFISEKAEFVSEEGLDI